jgi:hypothetical protein
MVGLSTRFARLWKNGPGLKLLHSTPPPVFPPPPTQYSALINHSLLRYSNRFSSPSSGWVGPGKYFLYRRYGTSSSKCFRTDLISIDFILLQPQSVIYKQLMSLSALPVQHYFFPLCAYLWDCSCYFLKHTARYIYFKQQLGKDFRVRTKNIFFLIFLKAEKWLETRQSVFSLLNK